jgi:hypothetical protein
MLVNASHGTSSSDDAAPHERIRYESPYDVARTLTIAAIRKQPDLPVWYTSGDGGDSARRSVVIAWEKSVEFYLDKSARGREERTTKLLDACEEYLWHTQYDQLAASWKATTSSKTWTTLTPSAQWLYAALHALAQERSSRGGIQVLLSNRAAKALIKILGGPTNYSLATISTARVALEKAGLVHVEVGQAHEKGKLSRPTKWVLLGTFDDSRFSELSLYPARDSSLLHSQEVPRLSDVQRKSLLVRQPPFVIMAAFRG